MGIRGVLLQGKLFPLLLLQNEVTRARGAPGVVSNGSNSKLANSWPLHFWKTAFLSRQEDENE